MIISFGTSSAQVFPEVDYNVVVMNHDFSKKLSLTGDAVLTPLRIESMVGPRGGACELVHTGYSWGPYSQDDEDKLIGAWVQVEADGTVIFVGRIMGVERRMGAEGDGEDRLVYFARDIWAALADQVVNLTFEDGISPGGVLGVLLGDPYIVTRRSYDTFQVKTISTGPLVPVDSNGNPLIEFADNLVSGGASSFPRRFDAEQVNIVIESMAREMGFEVIDFEPSPIGSGKLGKVVGRSIGAEERSLVFGAPSDTDWDDLSDIPFAIQITGSVDYQGVVTQIRAIGGDITQSTLAKLYPAWDESLNDAVLGNPKLLREQEGRFGMVGRIFFVGNADLFHGVVPFTEVPTKRALDSAFEDGSANVQDNVQIWEHILNKSFDPQDPTAWRENNSGFIMVPHNTSMYFNNQINYHGLKDAHWSRHNYALVVFPAPQINKVVLADDDGNRLERLYFKNNMYMETMRSIGRVGYLAPHRGKFPMVRERVLFDESYRKHSSYYKNESPFAYGHLRKTANAVEELPGVEKPHTSLSAFDNTNQLAFVAEKLCNEVSVPENSVEVQIAGLDKSWKPGQRIKELIDTDGNVFKGELDWDVRQVAYVPEEALTKLYFDNRLRIGAF